MGVNINTAIYSAQGVDINNVQSVAAKILGKAQTEKKEPVVQNIDYSKFNRNTLGINLYSSRTNVNLQKQISQIQAGLYAKAIDVSSLNSFAAQNLYSAAAVQKNVEATQSVQPIELIPPKQIEKQMNNIEIFNIADKNASSSGFNPFQKSEENENETN